MINIPKELYSKEILSILRECIDFYDIKNAYQIPDIKKYDLHSLASQALQYDVDMRLSSKALEMLSNYVLKRDHDYFIDFHHQVQEDFFNHYEHYFDFMIQEILDEIECSKKYQWRLSA